MILIIQSASVKNTTFKHHNPKLINPNITIIVINHSLIWNTHGLVNSKS